MPLWTAVAPYMLCFCILPPWCDAACKLTTAHTHRYTPSAIKLKIYVYTDRHTQANNSLLTNKLPAPDPQHINTHTDKHTQRELLLPPTMPPGVRSKCQLREKGLSTGAASEEASSTLHSPLEACLYTDTHAAMLSFSNKHPNTHTHIVPTGCNGWLADRGGADRQTGQSFFWDSFLFSPKFYTKKCLAHLKVADRQKWVAQIKICGNYTSALGVRHTAAVYEMNTSYKW